MNELLISTQSMQYFITAVGSYETPVSQSQRCNRYVPVLTTDALVKAVYFPQISAVTTYLLN